MKRRIFVLVVRGSQGQVDEWVEDGGVFYAVSILKIVRAGSHDCLRIVGSERSKLAQGGARP